MSTGPSTPDPTLLLVAGTGRSGTSTVAGALSRLGFAVPQPEVPADDTNPRGFYEPQWVVDFHKRIFDEIRIRTNDTRPRAVGLAAEASGQPGLLDELTGWLRPLAVHSQIVVKDPRTFWMHDLWRGAARTAGFDLAFLTMLRPPAEVAKSRDQHYLSTHNEESRRTRETTSVASWCHGILVTEQVTRGDRRAFVRYEDLMTDWRSALRAAGEHIEQSALTDIDDDPHPIDDFIEPKLNRSQVSWNDLSVHPEISDMADQIWAAVTRLAADPTDNSAIGELDALRAQYNRIHEFAEALTLQELGLVREAHRRRRDAMKQRQQERLSALRQKVRGLERSNAELTVKLELAQRSLLNRAAGRLRRR